MDTIERWTGPDGTLLAVRPMRPADAPALQALVEALPAQDRRWRFHGAVRSLPADALVRLATDAAAGQVALAAFTAGSSMPRLVAEVRCAAVPDGDDAEFALTVAAGWRRQGIGAHCLAALQRVAAQRGLRWLHGRVLADNAPMLALLRRCGFRCTPRGALVLAETCVAAPRPGLHEVLGVAAAAWRHA